MTDREQWRFQWPDGTWISWNPETQSWEKEDQGGEAATELPDQPDPPSRSAPSVEPDRSIQHQDEPPADPEAVTPQRPRTFEDTLSPSLPDEPSPTPSAGWKPVGETGPEIAAVPDGPPVSDEAQDDEAGPADTQLFEDSAQSSGEEGPDHKADRSWDELVGERRARERAGSSRARVGDVLPPMSEPDRPGGSLWPTIIAAIIVGLSVGLLLSSIIR